jgi:probable F420-dependent oxidoreductase
MVVMGFIAAAAPRLGLGTGVLVLPQRQTALVAKQAAEVDVLCDGRLRLTVGLGWNRVDFEGLGEDFHTRGARVSEQITLLRLLWTRPSVEFRGRWHSVSYAGLNPLPIQRPIPIWMGGVDDQALRRVARLADGFLHSSSRADPPALDILQRLRGFLTAANRGNDFGIECRISAGEGGAEQWLETAATWLGSGATSLSFNTRHSGFTTVREHLAALRRFKERFDNDTRFAGMVDIGA